MRGLRRARRRRGLATDSIVNHQRPESRRRRKEKEDVRQNRQRHTCRRKAMDDG